MHNDRSILKFTTSSGRAVYKLPVESFPNHVTNCYLVLDDQITLFDAASGWEASNESLLDAFARVRDEFSEKVELRDVKRLVLTHGHIDHFGGLNFVAEQSNALIGIHELDFSTVQHFKERLIIATTNLHIFLERAGLPPGRIAALLEMHKWSKDLFRARRVDFTFSEGWMDGSSFQVFHAPGHCPGQVCIKLDDILFTADHVLSHITPNQSPEFITRYTGLGHYFESLKRVRAIPGIRLALGGHEDPMEDLRGRIDQTLAFHDSRLDKTLALCSEPRTVAEVALGLFGERKDYHALLAILEAGAHMEYLYERGQLAVINIDEAEHAYNSVLVYHRQ